MRLFVSVLATAAIFFAASAASAAVTFTASATASGGDLSNMLVSDTVTIDINISSDGTATFGLGASVYGHDTLVADFQGGQAVAGYLYEIFEADAFHAMTGVSLVALVLALLLVRRCCCRLLVLELQLVACPPEPTDAAQSAARQ